IVGVRIHVVAVPWLARAAVAASVVGDGSVSSRRQEKHLVFESIRVERPAVAEDYRLSLPPIFVVDLRAVLRRDRRLDVLFFRSHGNSSFLRIVKQRALNAHAVT